MVSPQTSFCHLKLVHNGGFLILIEHSESKIITYFENEVEPGVLQSSVQQTYTLQNFSQEGQNRHIICDKYFESLEILQRLSLLNARLEHCRSDLVSKQPRLRDSFIFGMLYFDYEFPFTAVSFTLHYFIPDTVESRI